MMTSSVSTLTLKALSTGHPNLKCPRRFVWGYVFLGYSLLTGHLFWTKVCHLLRYWSGSCLLWDSSWCQDFAVLEDRPLGRVGRHLWQDLKNQMIPSQYDYLRQIYVVWNCHFVSWRLEFSVAFQLPSQSLWNSSSISLMNWSSSSEYSIFSL